MPEWLHHPEKIFVRGVVMVTDRVALDSMVRCFTLCKDADSSSLYTIVVCGDVVNLPYWYLDCSAAAQGNILLKHCRSTGLGAVWTAAYPYEDRIRVVRKYTGFREI